MENTIRQENHVFGNLWGQAGSGNMDRRIERAKNSSGQRALKFKTYGFYKGLILESDRRPGFEVKVYDLEAKPGLIDAEGRITFAAPLEIESLSGLLVQIDQWVSSYETLYGQGGGVIRGDVQQVSEESEEARVAEQGPVSAEKDTAEIPADNWDEAGGARGSDAAGEIR